MKLLTTTLLFIPFLAFAEDSYFFTIQGKPSKPSIQGEALIMNLPIKKISAPKASSIIAYHQGLGEGREYQIQVNLESPPDRDWRPMIKLGDDVIVEKIVVALPQEKGFASSFSLETDDPDKVKLWCKILGKILKVTGDKIEIDLSKQEAEQAAPSNR
jgi:hypothetical protein